MIIIIISDLLILTRKTAAKQNGVEKRTFNNSENFHYNKIKQIEQNQAKVDDR